MSYRVGKGKPPKHTQFKKGVSGNPEGARKHDPFKKLLKLSKKEIVALLEFSLLSTEGEIKKRISAPKTSAAEVIIGKALLKACKTANWKVLDSMIIQILGRAE